MEEDLLVVHFLCICGGSAQFGRSPWVSRSMECEVLSALSYPGFILSAFHASVLYDICFSVCCIWFSVLCLSCSGLVASTFQVIR